MGEPSEHTRWRHLLSFAALVAVVVQFLRGFRPPGGWAVTQLQFDYSFGFVRRGLPGAALDLVGVPVAKHTVAMTIGALLTVGALVATVWLVARSGLTKSLRGSAIALVAAASYAVALLGHLAGYYDHIVVALTSLLLVFLLRDPWPGRAALPASVLVGLLALLCHEMFLFVGVPVVCLAFWLRNRRRSAVVFAILMAGSTVVIVEGGDVEPETFREMVRVDEAATDFGVLDATYRVLRRSSAANVQQRIERLEQADPGEMLTSVIVLWPVLFLLVYVAARRVRAAAGQPPVARRIGLPLVLASGCGPLFLHLFGWDFHRFNALAVFSALAATVVVFRLTEERRVSDREQRGLARIAVVVVIIGLTAGFGFFNPYRPQPFPFRSHVNALVDALGSH